MLASAFRRLAQQPAPGSCSQITSLLHGPGGQHWAALFSTQQGGPADGLGAALDAGFGAAEAAPAPEQAAPEQQGSGVASTSGRPPTATGDRPGQAWGPRLVQSAQRGPAKPRPQEGIIHIHNSANNCIMVLTDREGKVKTWTSGGSVGFKNAGKATPQAAEAAAAELARRALEKGFVSVVVKLKGAGRTKQFAVQALAANGVTVTQLQDVTPIPYNGCRLPRKRRV